VPSRVRRLTSSAAGLGVLVAQMVYAVRRTDLPSLENQDPSGVFGSAASPLLRIAVLGDSSVTAPGVIPLDACWIRRLALELTDRYRVEIHSVAAGGARARDVLARQVRPAIISEPHIALVSVGANDALRGTSVGRFEAEIDHILSALRAAGIAVGISGVGDLGTIPRLPDVPRRFARIRGRAMDHAIVRAVRRHPGVLKTDTWSLGWEPFVNGNSTVIFAPDMFHASAEGHAIYAGAMRVVLNGLLQQIGR